MRVSEEPTLTIYYVILTPKLEYEEVLTVMIRFSIAFVILMLLFFAAIEPALANKFETISGGVSGLSREKLALIKQVSLYAGGFFLLLSLLMLINRNRFEGFVGSSSRKGLSSEVKGAIFTAVIGVVLVGLSFL